jgi:hypothetical protein
MEAEPEFIDWITSKAANKMAGNKTEIWHE